MSAKEVMEKYISCVHSIRSAKIKTIYKEKREAWAG
jgi:hypothetical protein